MITNLVTRYCASSTKMRSKMLYNTNIVTHYLGLLIPLPLKKSKILQYPLLDMYWGKQLGACVYPKRQAEIFVHSQRSRFTKG